MLLVHLLTTLLTLSHSVQAEECSLSSPCSEGCCSQSGKCGFGPDFCAQETCQSHCDRKSQCDPGYGLKWAERETCPLNLGCSPRGYCGTTEDYWTSKTSFRPTCSTSSGNSRVIGYFDGTRVNDRTCNAIVPVPPERIPRGVYTHINFAYALIDPATFRVVPSSLSDENLYRRVALLKLPDPGLKVFISIGGGRRPLDSSSSISSSMQQSTVATTALWEMLKLPSRQETFIDSLVSFMSIYNFDGADLDWAAHAHPEFERNDHLADFAHRLRRALDRDHDGLGKGKGKRKEISMTLPATYRDLQYFDIVILSKSVDWFNVKSLHDPRLFHDADDTRGIRGRRKVMSPHSNLTETDQTLDMLWRNGIRPDQVVMGLGFHGRSFTAASTSCLEPGCPSLVPAASDVVAVGRCDSPEHSLIIDFELEAATAPIVDGGKSQLYEAAGVKVATWGDQWLSYDDEETLALKSAFAQSRCLGGMAVWAVNYDTKYGKYGEALGRVANREMPTAASSPVGSLLFQGGNY